MVSETNLTTERHWFIVYCRYLFDDNLVQIMTDDLVSDIQSLSSQINKPRERVVKSYSNKMNKCGRQVSSDLQFLPYSVILLT